MGRALFHVLQAVTRPAAVEGEGQRDAFLLAYRRLGARIARFAEIPWEDLDSDALRQRLSEIGQMEGATCD